MNSTSDKKPNSGYQELAEKLNSLEQRIARLESAGKPYYSQSGKEETVDERQSAGSKEADERQIESSIGEYGLAWLGNIVLFFGIIFLVEYLRISGFNVISPTLGFAAVAGIFGLAWYFRNSNLYMAKIFDLNGYFLLYYIALKLHFFTTNPIIASKTPGLILLLIVTGILMFVSIRKKYTVLGGLSLILLAVTAVLSDSTHLMLSLAALISVISVIFLYRFGWIYQVYLSITLVYFISLLWMLGNPFMGHPMQAITNHQYGFNWLFLSAAVFSLIALMPEREESYTSDSIIGTVVYNSAGFMFTMGLCFLTFFKDSYAIPAGSIALYCLVYSIVLKARTKWKITGAIYALFGFVALSVCIYGLYGFPHAYFLLAFQSLLVVSIAIWFRSRFIVIMNSLMYILLLTVYLTTSDPGDAINISFSLVAFATARILNWQKERLTIRTDFIRNLYMIILFFMVLYTLYHLIPKQYITLSWTLAAVMYFLLSLILKNVKYRYMALGTMISAALFLFLVDLARIELVFRIIALLFLALISIGISFYYNKRLKKKVGQ